MEMPNSNLRAFNLAVSTLLSHPAQFLPHLTIPTFAHLPENLGPCLAESYTTTTTTTTSKPNPNSTSTTSTSISSTSTSTSASPKIKALILDKDNTLSPSKTTTFPPSILTKLHSLRHSPTSPFNIHNSPDSILIVSNRAGSHPRYDAEITSLEENGLSALKIPVFRLPQGSQKKPFCGDEVLDWFMQRGVVSGPEEIAVVGDRLGTDVLMAARMGAWSVWCRDGVVDSKVGRTDRNVLEKMEVWVERYLRESRGLKAPGPKGWNVRT